MKSSAMAMSDITNYLVTLGIFILTCNLIGLIPGFEAPTAVPSVPLGCAVVTWILLPHARIPRERPVGYVKHFWGRCGGWLR